MQTAINLHVDCNGSKNIHASKVPWKTASIFGWSPFQAAHGAVLRAVSTDCEVGKGVKFHNTDTTTMCPKFSFVFTFRILRDIVCWKAVGCIITFRNDVLPPPGIRFCNAKKNSDCRYVFQRLSSLDLLGCYLGMEWPAVVSDTEAIIIIIIIIIIFIIIIIIIITTKIQAPKSISFSKKKWHVYWRTFFGGIFRDFLEKIDRKRHDSKSRCCQRSTDCGILTYFKLPSSPHRWGVPRNLGWS